MNEANSQGLGMLDITYFGAMLAGLLSFFTPCVLPMVPFYLGYMGGMSVQELRGDDKIPAGHSVG